MSSTVTWEVGSCRTGEPALLLSDGPVRFEPQGYGDRAVVEQVFGAMSDRSRLSRFLVPTPRLSGAVLAALTTVDGRRHYALAAYQGDGRAIGIGRFVMTEAGRAEIALSVVDDWQGRGVGTALLRQLADEARGRGLEAFEGAVLTDNRPMWALLSREFAELHVTHLGGAVEFEAPLIPRARAAAGA